MQVCEYFNRDTMFDDEQYFQSFHDIFCSNCPKHYECYQKDYEKCDNHDNIDSNKY